jgi:hypothetical protein
LNNPKWRAAICYATAAASVAVGAWLVDVDSETATLIGATTVVTLIGAAAGAVAPRIYDLLSWMILAGTFMTVLVALIVASWRYGLGSAFNPDNWKLVFLAFLPQWMVLSGAIMERRSS